jgi:putative protein-disulfide isomerase
MQPTIIYCYDAYCGWCYGFSEVIKKLHSTYKNVLDFEVLSGGLILPETPQPVGIAAKYIQEGYKQVEELTGAKFGEDYLWHINHPDQSDWFPHSEKPAIALCVFKEFFPDQQVSFAADLQFALHFEGRDLTGDAAYASILEKYNFPHETFYENLHDEQFKEQAHYEFALCKQLQVTGFPAVLLQISESKFHLLARGYTAYEELEGRIENVLKEISGQ